MKFEVESILRNAMKKTGGWYIPLMVLAVQFFAFISSALAAYFIQNNAQFSQVQFAASTRSLLILVVIGNGLMVGWAYLSNRTAQARLNDWTHGKSLSVGTTEETLAWRQVNSLPLRFMMVTFIVALFVQTFPLLAYLYFRLNITSDQAVYGILGGLAATLLGSSVAMHALDFSMRPVRKVLLPQGFDAQIKNVAAFPLANKLIGSTLTLIIISMLIIAPIGYHHTVIAITGGYSSINVLQEFQIQSIVGGLVSVLLGLVLAFFIFRSLTTPIERLIQAFQKVEQGDFTQHVSVATADEVGKLAIYFNRMTERLSVLQSSLETQVKERTAQLRATVQVSRAASAILDTNELIEQVVNLIAKEFGYYYVALFLSDSSGKWAELKSATGDAGRVLRENRHRLEIGGKSMVGTAISTREPKVAQNTGSGPIRFDNPLLPYTRSEIALPLIVGDHVLGVLDAQSTHESAFGPEDIETLQTMANQVAIAIENARLFQEAQQNLQDMRAIQQQYLLTSWKGITEEKSDLHYENGELEEGGVFQESTFPLTLRDQLIGQISLSSDEEWTADEKSMIEAIASQAALALENARLVEESQSTLVGERLTNEITAKIWSSSNVDAILQTAVRELGRALNATEATIELSIDPLRDSHNAKDRIK
jgi:GAF domain-containing protein/HAMP domain-containing protein